ncbi:MAG: hypothetical protein D3923_19895, partial [Candidatus Electrothrix sp. AR3]|nr:hypothetical protein [Candidatus Electrothrix sp. AR3]
SQLNAIATLGLRGEALPSIASVSRMTILSRTRDGAVGAQAEIRYGVLHDVHEEGCTHGTIIEVRSLFGSLPARRKFLKTKRTELAHIEEILRSQALAHPEIAFSLFIDGRKTITLPPATEKQRMRDVFRCPKDSLLPVQTVALGKNSPAIHGWLLLSALSGSARLRILVNKRPVQDRMIRQAITEGLQGFLMKGQQAAGVIQLEISPEQVDVNVHPAKREIRFRNPQEMQHILIQAISKALQQQQEEMRAELFTAPQQEALSPQILGEQPLEQSFSPLPFPSSPTTQTVEKSSPLPPLKKNKGQPIPVTPLSLPSSRERTDEPSEEKSPPLLSEQQPQYGGLT